MSYRRSCRRSIPVFALALSLFLPAAPAAGTARAGDRGSAQSGRVALVLESLWQWLGFAPGTPAPLAAPTTAEGESGTDTDTDTDTGTGGETQGSHDPNGAGNPPPEYYLDLEPGGGTGGGG